MSKSQNIPSPLWGELGRGCEAPLERKKQTLFFKLRAPSATPSLALWQRHAFGSCRFVLPTRGRGLLACLIFLSLLASPLHAADEIDNTSHLPVPRFATLRSGEVNMRTGPGTRYPIEWVYARRGLPVEVTAEYDIWRRVRDPEGTEGWVNKTELTGKRGAIITGTGHDIYDSRNEQSAVLAHLETGAIGQIVSCAQDWCKVKFAGVKGYLRKTDFWGAYPTETFD